MDNQQFAAVLQGAVAGRHEDLEQILELYEPLIRKSNKKEEKRNAKL